MTPAQREAIEDTAGILAVLVFGLAGIWLALIMFG